MPSIWTSCQPILLYPVSLFASNLPSSIKIVTFWQYKILLCHSFHLCRHMRFHVTDSCHALKSHLKLVQHRSINVYAYCTQNNKCYFSQKTGEKKTRLSDVSNNLRKRRSSFRWREEPQGRTPTHRPTTTLSSRISCYTWHGSQLLVQNQDRYTWHATLGCPFTWLSLLPYVGLSRRHLTSTQSPSH